MRSLEFDAVVIGTGCAGYNAADWLYDLGVKNVAIITEGKNIGTSRNTGSDKQTYYKLSLAGDAPDSVMNMARTLFDGGAMDGDVALAEAAKKVYAFDIQEQAVASTTARRHAYTRLIAPAGLASLRIWRRKRM